MSTLLRFQMTAVNQADRYITLPFETEEYLHHAGDTLKGLKGEKSRLYLIVLSVGYGFY
ncbi:hypothetical protein LGZ99_06045 [Photorhabdus temperata]|uniref:Uncharacterized protein n=1 Tax=Photorhabdus temperata subsp. temperata Meg1 TaxID=1393735 RepID=A0A081RXB7_PHOTE|nr:hypothetical protein [Photorhabdus temperata]KER03320.1 hypothetical protein MEG1DRAFT_01998 [Photorhabdus temperata subsp. temperata Meg1]MCT8346784.1 hypothetical protein [Photorhabdus temperata]